MWHGEIGFLDDARPEPAPPRLSAEARPLLPEATDRFLTKHGSRVSRPVVFAMPFDETRTIDAEKFRKISTGLAAHFHPTVHVLPMDALGLPQVDDFAPTTRVVFFLMDGPDPDKVQSELKKQLYVPSKDRKTDTDRFRLEAHGYLLTTEKATTSLQKPGTLL